MSAAFSKRSQNRKSASAQGSLEFRECQTASGKVPGERKSKKVSYLLTHLLTVLLLNKVPKKINYNPSRVPQLERKKLELP